MTPQRLRLTDREKLSALHEVDIFHRWSSIEERRYCRRCGESFSGREIKVFAGRRGEGQYRLECPTEGCPAVPIEWIVLEAEPQRPVDSPQPVIEAGLARAQIPRPQLGLFSFLRVPWAFH